MIPIPLEKPRVEMNLAVTSLVAVMTIAIASAAPGGDPPGSGDGRWRAAYDTQEAAFQEARREPARMDATLDSLDAFADRLADAPGITPTLRDSLLALAHDRAGIFAFRLSRLDEAADHFDEGVRRARASGDAGLSARLLNSKAVGHAARGDVEGAVRVWRELLPVREELADSNGVAVTWSNLGGGYRHLGRVPEAIDATERALTIQLAIRDSSGISSSYARLAELFSVFSRYREALAFADSAVAISAAAGLHTSRGLALIRRAEARLELGQPDSSLADVARSIAAHEESNDQYYREWGHLVDVIIRIEVGRAASALDRIPPLVDSDLARTSPEFSIRLDVAHAAALVHEGRLDEATPLLASALERFETHRDQLVEEESRIGAFDLGGELYATLAALELRRGRPRDAWLAAERGRAAVLRAQLSVEVDPASAVPEVLADADAILVQYLTSHLHPTVAFVVTPDEVRAVRLGERRVIDQDAGRVADLLAGGEPAELTARALARLAEALIHPVLAEMPDAARLYLVPPVRMSGFPFELLPDPSGTPLGDRMAITHLPSASVLPTLAARAASPHGMLALADPTVDADAMSDGPVDRGGFGGRLSRGITSRSALAAPLPHAREEVARIRTRDADVRIGGDATRAAATGDPARRAAVLHFATHAAVDPLYGERSALVLAGSDGLLTAAEVESIPYRADLVTLSGCQTKGGYPTLGEGTLGLTRAFLLAGSRSVVSSLWDVEDEATSHFMDRFYAGLREGLPRDESLRRARRELAAEGVPARDHAAFVLTGLGHEPVRSLVGESVAPRRSTWIVAALPVLVLVIVLGAWTRRRRSPRTATVDRSGP